jgi:hypothetical protein
VHLAGFTFNNIAGWLRQYEWTEIFG